MADGFQMHELAAAHDADHGAGEPACLDLAAQGLADTAKPE